jgi:hypothetical protein
LLIGCHPVGRGTGIVIVREEHDPETDRSSDDDAAKADAYRTPTHLQEVDS